MLPYATNPPPFLFDTSSSSSFLANNIHEVDTLPPLAFLDAYNIPFFSFESTPLPPPDPVAGDGTNGGGRRKRRRGQRNDRHSKIRTTKGLRDRRMRLSVDIANRFFALQDMLGLEKASATIDWLLKQSKSAIEQAAVRASVFASGPTVPSAALLVDIPSCSCFPKSTELSGNSLQITSDHVVPEKAKEPEVHTISRRDQSRADARARARCRTIEKKNKNKMLLEAEDGGIGGQFDSAEQFLYQYSMEKGPSLVGSGLQTSAHAEYSSSSSFSQGGKLVDDTTKEYNFESLPMGVDGESSPLCMFGDHQSKDYSLISIGTGASYELVFQEDYITGNFSVGPEYQNLRHKNAELIMGPMGYF